MKHIKDILNGLDAVANSGRTVLCVAPPGADWPEVITLSDHYQAELKDDRDVVLVGTTPHGRAMLNIGKHNRK